MTHEPAQHGELADRSLGDVVESVASTDIAPGAGAAAAAVLALAAACAGKAVAITRKRHSGDPVLRDAQDTLANIRHLALRGAALDSERFREFVHEKNREAAQRLIDSGAWLQQMAGDLSRVLDVIEARIEPGVRADVVAARTLNRAFATIQRVNLAENRRAADELG